MDVAAINSVWDPASFGFTERLKWVSGKRKIPFQFYYDFLETVSWVGTTQIWTEHGDHKGF